MRSKYETNVKPNLDKIARWAGQGATVKEIAGKLKLSYSTLRKYIDDGDRGVKRYAALSAVFAQARAVVDDQVEAALFRRAVGISYTETRREEVIDRKTGEREILTTRTKKLIPPDPTSAIFWLTNRVPERYRQRGQESGREETGGVIVLAEPADGDGPAGGDEEPDR